VDRIGRRPLIIASAVGLSVTTLALSLAFYGSCSPVIVVILLCAVMATYSAGVGPFSYLVASENLGLSERAMGMTLCAAANRCMSGIVALSTVSLYEALGNAGFFALYGAVGVISICFYYTAVPETSGLSLEELAARARENDANDDDDSGCKSAEALKFSTNGNHDPRVSSLSSAEIQLT